MKNSLQQFLKIKFYCLKCILLFVFLYIQSVVGQRFKEAYSSLNISNLTENSGHAIADFDLDGDLDIFVVAIKTFNRNDQTSKSRLLRNDDGIFIDVTSISGFNQQYTNTGAKGDMGDDMGASWGDYDNDGYPDLILTHFGKVQLFHNDGKGFFEDVTDSSGIIECKDCYNSSALWWDYNKDGALDFYISDWQKENKLYKNQKDGTFIEVSMQTKVNDAASTWTSVPIDINNDGWLDLYVVNDFTYNNLFLNNRGIDFTEVAEEYNLNNFGNGMGVTIGDYNNDGLFDIYLTNIFEFYPNPLFEANPNNKAFYEKANNQGVDDAGWAWGTSFFDADLDGDEDLYVANGFDGSISANKFFKNMRMEGEEKFIDFSGGSQTDGDLSGFAQSTFDLDNDGDLDLFITNTNGIPYFYENKTIEKNKVNLKKWLKVKLEGTSSNKNGFGTVIEVYANEQSYHRLYHGAGFLSQNIQSVHFGLAANTKIDTLIVKWPNSSKEVFYDIETNQTVEIIEHTSFTGSLSTLSVDSDLGSLDNTIHLKVFPNPFIDTVTFEFMSLDSYETSLYIYNVNGELIYKEKYPQKEVGKNYVNWNSRTNTGQKVSNGVYFYKLIINQKTYSDMILKF